MSLSKRVCVNQPLQPNLFLIKTTGTPLYPTSLYLAAPFHRYLDMAFTEGSGIRKMDSSRVFSSVASNDISRDLAWNFLKNELDRIMT